MINMLKIGNSEILKIYAGNTEITKAFLGAEQVYPDSTPPTPTDFSGLTFEIQSDGNIVLYTNGNFEGKQIQYSKNGGAWTNAQFEQYGYTITVVSGDTLQFRGNNDCYFESGHSNFFDSTASFKVKGNIMSLISYDFENLLGFSGETNFMLLFQRCFCLTDASELLLPATALTKGCYELMFSNCSALTATPSILPATTLGIECYLQMFQNCKSLESAPILPATTLANKCYWGMFSGCSSLSAITCLAEDISATGCTNAWVSGVSQTGYFSGSTLAGWTLDSVNGVPIGWDSNLAVDYKSMPLTFEIISGGTIMWFSQSNPKVIEYSKDNGVTWTSITSSRATSITVETGDKVQFRGNNAAYGGSSDSMCSTFLGSGANESTAVFVAYGNIMSLVDGNNYEGLQFTTANTNCFRGLFNHYGSTISPSLIQVDNLILPDNVVDSCYRGMFARCGIDAAPALPATTLASNCYAYMFQNCTYLATAPELPATTLSEDCYRNMFYNCTSLTTAPALPATTLAINCYRSMFYGCTSLTTPPSDFLPATTLAESCYFSMFQGCTGLTAAPDLLASTLAASCYRSMFQNCLNLRYIKCLATDISANVCTTDWVKGVASDGTFVTPSSTNWTTGASGIPSGWTRVNA